MQVGLGWSNQEFICENVPAENVARQLRAEYPGVRFPPHPTLNAFYVIGNKAIVLEIKQRMPELDRVEALHLESVRLDDAVRQLAVKFGYQAVIRPELDDRVDVELDRISLYGGLRTMLPPGYPIKIRWRERLVEVGPSSAFTSNL